MAHNEKNTSEPSEHQKTIQENNMNKQNQNNSQNRYQQQTRIVHKKLYTSIFITTGQDGFVKFWDFNNFQCFANISPNTFLPPQWNVLEVTNDQNYLFCGGPEKIQVISMNEVKTAHQAYWSQPDKRNRPFIEEIKRHHIQHISGSCRRSGVNVVALKACGNGNQMLAGSDDGYLRLLGISNKQNIHRNNTNNPQYPNSERLTFDRQWEVQHDSPITAIVNDPMIKYQLCVFVADQSDKIVMYNMASGYNPEFTLYNKKKRFGGTNPNNKSDKPISSYMTCLDIDIKEGKFLVAGDKHGDITVFHIIRDESCKIIKGQIQQIFNGHNYYVTKIRFSVSGDFICSVSADNMLYCLQRQTKDPQNHLWRETIKKEMGSDIDYELRDHFVWDFSIVESNDFFYVITVGADRCIRLWQCDHNLRMAKLSQPMVGFVSPNYKSAYGGKTNAVARLRHDNTKSLSDREFENMLANCATILDNVDPAAHYGAIYAITLKPQIYLLNVTEPVN